MYWSSLRLGCKAYWDISNTGPTGISQMPSVPRDGVNLAFFCSHHHWRKSHFFRQEHPEDGSSSSGGNTALLLSTPYFILPDVEVPFQGVPGLEASEAVRRLEVREKLLFLGQVALNRQPRQHLGWVKSLGNRAVFLKVWTLDLLHLSDPAPGHRIRVCPCLGAYVFYKLLSDS